MDPKSKNRRCFVFLSHGDAGGISTYQANQIRNLLASNERVVLVDDNPEATLSNKCLNHVGLGYVGVINSSVWSSPYAISKSIEYIIRENSKIFVLISNPLLLLVRITDFLRLKFNKNIYIILTLHSKITFKNKVFNKLGEYLISIIIYLIVDRIIFVSNFTKKYWKKFYLINKIKSTVIKNGLIIIPEVKARHTSSVLRIAFVGRLAVDKDPELFCQLAKDAYILDLGYQFNIYGDGPLFATLKLNYGKYANFFGWTSEVDIYDNVDILIISSPIENAPFAILEAKNHGIPVIAKNVGGIPEIVTNEVDGFLLNEWTSNSVIYYINEIQKNYQRFFTNCINRRVLYDANKSAKKFLRLIKSF